MDNFFITEGRWAGYYALTDIGAFITLVVGAVLFLALAGSFFKRANIPTKALTYAGLALALAFVLSYFRLFAMPLGGSVTPMSMFFVALIGLMFGPAVGLVSAFAYGLLQFAQGPMVLHPFQMILDYPLAFGMLGLAGFFYKGKGDHFIFIGFLVAATGRFVMHTISGYFFFSQYAPPDTHPLWHSIIYNAGYIYAEAGITIAILLLPQVRGAIARVKNQAIA